MKFALFLEEPSAMTFNPRQFNPMVVTDTCSIWNILSAQKLYKASFGTSLLFLTTPMVIFECLKKPRKSTSPENEELIRRLQDARKQGKFSMQQCELSELLEIAKTAPLQLNSGELSCLAMASKIKSIAFMTDEKRARRFAETRLGLYVETTAKLYGWLHYHRHLTDADHQELIAEHERYEKRPLTVHLNKAYITAHECRLKDREMKQ